MRRVTANDYQTDKWMDYSADGIRLINDVSQISRPTPDAFINDMVIVNVCQRGKSIFLVDGHKYTLKRNEMLILQPNCTIGSYQCSDDFDCRVLLFSLKNIENSIFIRRKLWASIDYLRQHPILSLTADDLQVLYHYYSIITSNHSITDNVSKDEIVSHLLKSLVYEFLLIVERVLVEKGQTSNLNKQSSNDDLCRRFLEQLAFFSGHIRKVSQYAERLSVTPKHLAAVVKSISGRTVIEWINESSIKAITNELRYTQKTISEIVQEFDFPSLSFFGKYFKKHTGFSPRAYRERLVESVP